MNKMMIAAVILAMVVASYVMWTAGQTDDSGGIPATEVTQDHYPLEIVEERLNGVALDERANLYASAERQSGEQAKEWPRTERELIEAFWQAISQGDLERATLLCPGSTATDFKAYYAGGKSPSPARQIGAPEPHPQYPKIQVWPATVDFPHAPGKVIRMAILKMENDRLGIDGRFTQWW